jgi:hypothetical protein
MRALHMAGAREEKQALGGKRAPMESRRTTSPHYLIPASSLRTRAAPAASAWAFWLHM